MNSAERETWITERTTLRAWLTAVCIGIAGLILITVADTRGFGLPLFSILNTDAARSIVTNIGSLLVASIAISLLWELGGKRAFADELLYKMRLSDQVVKAGIEDVTDDLFKLDWKPWLQDVKELDIFFTYGRSWRGAYRNELSELASRRNARIRVVLPDPEDETTIDALAHRLSTNTADIRGRILDAAKDFRRLRSQNAYKGAEIKIWWLRGEPMFSFYRLDNKIVLSLNSHRRRQLDAVPTLVLRRGGILYDYLKAEFNAVVDTEIDEGGSNTNELALSRCDPDGEV